MREDHENLEYENTFEKKDRMFPLWKTVLLFFLILVQVGIVFLAVRFDPKPQDVILDYAVLVDAQDDGSLDIEYRFVWKALDKNEPLTWVEIGMANDEYTVYAESLSETILHHTKVNYDGEVYLELDFDRAYSGGEIVEFSFKVNQKEMLCKDGEGYFYEFVPGWFNATPVEHYSFRWVNDEGLSSALGGTQDDWGYTWSGSFECGGYEKMSVRYDKERFIGCDTVRYRAFDDAGTYNALKEDKVAIFVLSLFGVGILVVIQIWIVDSVVSYHRGRGFLTGYGHHVHIYGRSNPHYIRARDRYNKEHAGRSGGRSGGCACACACACAGGGRAGCSQKDTFENKLEREGKDDGHSV